jgi:hypothetical protein
MNTLVVLFDSLQADADREDAAWGWFAPTPKKMMGGKNGVLDHRPLPGGSGKGDGG